MIGDRLLAEWVAPVPDCAVLSGAAGLIIVVFRPDGTPLIKMGVQSHIAMTSLIVIGMPEAEFQATEGT